jgi:hypothetical protein
MSMRAHACVLMLVQGVHHWGVARAFPCFHYKSELMAAALRGIQVVLLGEVGPPGGTCRAVQYHLPDCVSSTVVHVEEHSEVLIVACISMVPNGGLHGLHK